MENIIYCFLSDEALLPRTSTSYADQGYGVLLGEPSNYLYNYSTLNDQRDERLPIVNNERARGQLRILFDKDRTNMTSINALTKEESDKIFNVIERIYLQQEYSVDNLEHVLVNTSEYDAYVAKTFIPSVDGGEVIITDEGLVEKTIPIKDSCVFDVSTGSVSFKIHMWIASEAFAQEYPYTTITTVIPPYDPTILTDPAVLVRSGNLQILADGSSFIFEQSNLDAIIRDTNGVFTYKTKYVIDSTTSMQMPFALPYCGKNVPDSLDCRKAIREFLEENTTLSREQIAIIFPELYISSRFYLAPLWDIYTERPDRDVYNSIMVHKNMRSKAAVVFESTDSSFIDNYMEVLTNAQDKIWTIAVPDQLNDSIFSILEQHPTYQDYSSQVPGWKWMEAETQEFAGKLIRCFSVLTGVAVSSEFIEVEINGILYLSFTAGKAEYLVMKKESYLSLFLGG